MQPTELLKQGQLLRRQDRSEAIACFEESIQRAESVNDQILIADALIELAIELAKIGQIPALIRAKNLLNRSMYLLEHVPDSLSTQIIIKKDYIIYAQGLLSHQEGEFQAAISQLSGVRSSFGNDAQMQAALNQSLAESYLALGEFKSVRQYILENHGTNEFTGGYSYEQLGRLHLQLDQYPKAKEYFGQSLDLALALDDKYLRVRAFIGLSQVAIAEQQWESAITVINEVLSQLDEPLDTQESAYLYLYLAEAKIGIGEILLAQEYVQNYAIPRFEKLQNRHGLAAAKRTLARVMSNRLANGMDEMSEEMIEAIADEFLEALILFETYGTPQEKAKTLYDLANLYTLSNEPRYKYQFHGKAVRSLEQALLILIPTKEDSPFLIAEIEGFLNSLMGDFS